MTDEEKLAEEYTKTNTLKGLSYRQITETYDEISGYPYFLEDKIKQAFLAGLEAGQASTVRTDNTETLENALNRIAELESQIEKMKCCEMCKHKNLNWEFSPICEARDKITIENPLTCKCDKWSMRND